MVKRGALLELKSLIDSIRNFEGITRKNLIKDVTGLLKGTNNIAGNTVLGFGDDASALEIENGQVVLLAADGMWGKLCRWAITIEREASGCLPKMAW